MKSRSHRLPTSDPPDDWVNGSWTVDCVCGVNFDDGEEMVNCDECGVWVHTRCSRYVKGEKVFVCDKCKTKNSIRNDSQETEVAQFLVELPTKTLRMDNPSYNATGPPPPKKSFRLWTDIPMEQRVHVQGIPGGDPGLFDGSSSIFSPQLWRSTGYVPKKLNFQYREFPCWDEHQDADKKREEEEKGNHVDKGAGVLFSLLKDNVLPTSVVASSIATKKKGDEHSSGKLSFSKDRESEHLDPTHPENGLTEDGTLRQPIVFHSGKQKKEDLRVAKDKSWRKKVKTVNKEADFKESPLNILRRVSTLSSDAKPLEFYEDRVTKAETDYNKNGNRANTLPDDLSSDDNCMEEDSICNHKFELVSAVEASEALPPDVIRNKASNKSRPDRDNAGLNFSARIQISKKANDGITSLNGINSKISLVMEEVANNALDKLSEGRGSTKSIGIDSHKSEPLENNLASATSLAKDNQENEGCLQPHVRVKEEADTDKSIGLANILSLTSSDRKLDGMHTSSKDSGLSADRTSKNIKVDDTAVASLQFIDRKVQDLDGGMIVEDKKSVKDDESTTCQQNCQSVVLEPFVHQKTSLEGKHGPASADESLRSGGTTSSLSVSSSLHKVVVRVGKSSPTSSIILNSRSSASDNHRPQNTASQNTGTRQNGVNDCNISSKKDNSLSFRDEGGENPNTSTTKNGVGDFNMTNMKDNASTEDNVSTDVIRDNGGSEHLKTISKEIPKSSFSLSKASHLSKLSHASAIKRTLSVLKDVSSSTKTSLAENFPHTSSCGQPNLSQSENASCIRNKTAASDLPQRGEKTNQSNCQTSSKVNRSQSMLPPTPLNPAAMLSDEELALLLHQELNSSPRVPRVPRMRHAGSLPQLGSPTSTGVLTKRASSSGGRDQILVSRKKNKDFAQDGSRSSCNLDDESKKPNRGTSLHDQTRHDSVYTRDGLCKKVVDNTTAKAAVAAKKGMTLGPTITTSSCLSSSTEANEQNLPSTRNSARNASDEDAGTASPTHHTLPGLIAEIMSKGERMTYEELCNAVLPHWPHLRKHNGERYAYTGHVQAVVDCLRNRNEWSRLIDRGPKTSASRKRRKVDADPSSFESGDNECSRDLTAKEVESQIIESHREDFPKGKRKARKRRRLALQGRGINDVRRRRKTDFLTDDDMVLFSNSSEESMFSDDDIQGGERCPNGSEASASSNETGSTS